VCLLVVWFLLVTLLSLAPLRVKLLLHTIGPLHDAGHVVVFSASGIFLLATAPTPIARVRRIAALFPFCVLLEAFQILYGNRFEWDDLFIDSLAIAFSAVVWTVYQAFSTTVR